MQFEARMGGVVCSQVNVRGAYKCKGCSGSAVQDGGRHLIVHFVAHCACLCRGSNLQHLLHVSQLVARLAQRRSALHLLSIHRLPALEVHNLWGQKRQKNMGWAVRTLDVACTPQPAALGL